MLLTEKVAVVGVLIALITLAYQVMPSLLPRFGWISPGWEIYDSVGGIRHNSQLYTEASDFEIPNDLMGVYWKVDVDAPYYGVATLMVEVSDISHVDFSGKETPAEQPASTMTVMRGNDTYYLDYHIYKYTATIRTIADYQKFPGSTFTLDEFNHETNWDNVGHGGLPPRDLENGTDGHYVGDEFSGGVFTKFTINPWKGVSYHIAPNETYALNSCWAGVMNTYVLLKNQGQVDNQWGEQPEPSPGAELRIIGGIDQGNQVPMFADDGTFGTPAPKVDWGSSVTPDTRIATSVVHYLPVQMIPGCKYHFNAVGNIDEIYPCDGAIQYTLRIDVLMTHQFTLKTAINPPDVTWPRDYFGWAEDFWVSVFRGLNPFSIFGAYAPFVAFIALGFIGLIIMLVLIAVFAPWLLPRLSGMIGETRKAYRKSSR